MIAYIGAEEPEYTQICGLLRIISSMTGKMIKPVDAIHITQDLHLLRKENNSIFIIAMGWREIDPWSIEEHGIQIFLFAWNTLYNPWDCDFLLKLRDKSIETGDYYHAKGINDILIETDWITRRSKTLGYPNELQLESTSRCNAHCIMCEHYYTDNDGCGDLKREVLSSLCTVFPCIKEVYMHGLGEPMLYSDLEYFLHQMKSFQIRISCNSNLSVLPKKMMSLIADTFHGISVSCDGCDEETFSKIRRGLSLRTVLQNVKMLRESAPQIELRMSIVAMRQNITKLPDIIQLAHEIGVEAVQIAYVVPNPLLENENDSLHHYPAHTKKYFDIAAKRAASYGIRAVFPQVSTVPVSDELLLSEKAELEKYKFVALSREDCRKKADSLKEYNLAAVRDMRPSELEDSGYPCRGICDYLLEKPYIDHNGNVFLCCINPTYRIGNILRDGGLEQIWNSENYRKIRKLFYNGHIPNCCTNCQFLINHNLKRIRSIEIDDSFYRKAYPGKEYREIIQIIERETE